MYLNDSEPQFMERMFSLAGPNLGLSKQQPGCAIAVVWTSEADGEVNISVD